MKIESGKFYKRRDGVVVGPMRVGCKGNAWVVTTIENGVLGYCEEGSYFEGMEDSWDLVEEAPEPISYQYNPLKARDDKIAELEAQLVVERNIVDEFRKIDMDIVRASDAFKQERDTLKAQFAELEVELSRVTLALNKVREQRNDVIEQRHILRQRVEDLEGDYDQTNDELKDKLLTVHKSWSQSEDVLRKSVESLTLKNGRQVFEMERYASEALELRKQLDKKEQLLQAYETQLTLQDEGPAQLLERCERQKRDLDYYAGQLAQSEMNCKASIENNKRLSATLETTCDDRDELRDQLDEANERLEAQTPSAPTINGNQHTPNSDFTADDLRARVKELQAPTIVKSTWQGLYKNGCAGDVLNDKLGNLYRWYDFVLRRDHWSDGTVTATLEPTGEK